MDSLNIYQRKLVLFSGKGGVGKTTIASAFALSCARRGERTLLMELNTKDKVSLMFGAGHVGPEIREIEDNLFAVNVTPDAAQEEYAVMILKLRVVYRAVFENKIMRAFLKAIPGLNELVMLGKAYYHVIEENDDGTPTWDKIVVDAPATGHGIFLLQIPSVITSILGSGHLYEEAERILNVMQDPKLTAINLVTLPEEMPVNETEMLLESVRDELKMPLGYVIINALYPQLFSEEELKMMDENRPDLEAGDLVANLIDAAQFRNMRHQMQQGYVEQVHERIDLPAAHVDFHFVDHVDFPTIDSIGASLAEQMGGE